MWEPMNECEISIRYSDQTLPILITVYTKTIIKTWSNIARKWYAKCAVCSLKIQYTFGSDNNPPAAERDDTVEIHYNSKFYKNKQTPWPESMSELSRLGDSHL
jgi:hypothetical protein